MAERVVHLYVSTNKTGKYMILPYLDYCRPDRPGYNALTVDEPNGRRAKQLAVKLMRQAIADGAEGINVEYEFDWIDGARTLPEVDRKVHVCARKGPRLGRYVGRCSDVNGFPVFELEGLDHWLSYRFWSDELTGRKKT